MSQLIDTDKYEGHTSDWKWIYIDGDYHGRVVENDFYLYSLQSIFGNKIIHDTPDGKLAQDAPLILAEVKRLRVGIRGILSDYDITELIRDVPEDEWNFEQQALVRMKELIE